MAGLHVSYAARRRLRAASSAGFCLAVGVALGCVLALSLQGPQSFAGGSPDCVFFETVRYTGRGLQLTGEAGSVCDAVGATRSCG